MFFINSYSGIKILLSLKQDLTSFVSLYDINTKRSGPDCTSANTDYFIARF